MNQTKVIAFLKTFDKKEFQRFGLFLESPYFFQGRKINDVIDLIQYLERYHPDYEHPKLTKEKVFAKVFLGEPYKERKFQHLMTKTNKAIEQFIDVEYRPKIFGYPTAEMSFARFYREKNLQEPFYKVIQKAETRQLKTAQKDTYNYWVDYLLAKELAEQKSIFNVRKTDINLSQTLSKLDYFFLTAKLESACVYLNQIKHQVPLDSNGELDALEAILPLLQKGKFREEPLVDLLYKTYQLLQSDCENQYRKLKEVYNRHAMHIGLHLRQIIHATMRNFCTLMLNNGDDVYIAELYFLYREGLPQDVLGSNGGILSATFQSIATIGIRQGEYNWVEAFLEDYCSQIIGTDEPNAVYSLSWAQLFFAKKEYEKALNCLRYNFADIYLKLIARRLEVQIYYELDSTLIDSKIQAFKIFVFRKSKSRITNLQHEGYSNFIDMLKQIIHPSTLDNSSRIEGLVNKIKTKKVIAERKWLLSLLTK